MVAILLVLYFLSPFFAVARLQFKASIQGAPSPIGRILYFRFVDSRFAVEVVGEKVFAGERRTTAYPYFVVREGLFWRAVQMSENTKQLFQESNDRSAFYVFESFAERLGPYTVLCLGSRYLEKNNISVDQVYDSEGTEPLVLSHETLHKDVDWGRWGAIDGENMAINFRMRDLSGYGVLFAVKDMPETYRLYCGDSIITAAEIDARFGP